MQLVHDAVANFVKLHGHHPKVIFATPHALLAIGAHKNWAPIRDSEGKQVPIEIKAFSAADAVAPGSGTYLGLFVRTNGVQEHIAAVELKC